MLEQGIPFYRVTLHLKHQGSYAGAFWEVTRGAVNVANSTSFTCKMRGASDSHGRLQIKFETQDGWPVYYAPFPPRQWKSIGPLRLTQVGAADWSRLERITIAADDRDLACGADHVVDVADFFFHYESEPPIETPNKTLNPIGNKPAS